MTTQQSDPSVPLPGETPQQYGLRRLRGWRPSPEERAVLEKYKVRAAGYSTTFMLGWSGLSFAFARYRKLALMPTFAITAVGAFLGSQAGKLAGIYQGLEEIKTLPNSELTQIMTDFTKVAQDQVNVRRGMAIPSTDHRAPPPSSFGDLAPPPPTRLPDPLPSASSAPAIDTPQTLGVPPTRPSDAFFDDEDDDPMARRTGESPLSTSSTATGWSRVRQDSQPPSAWSELRSGARASAGGSSTWDTLRTGGTGTGADRQHVGPRNSYGDVVE